MVKLDNNFIKTIVSIYKDKGVQWIENLPFLIEQCAQKWHLSEITTVAHLTYNYVAYAQQAGKSVVLKLRCNQEELEKEINALHIFACREMVAVRAYDICLGAMLLECIQPGESLASYVPDKDQQATEIATYVVRRLHQKPITEDTTFPLLDQVLPKFDKDFCELAPFLKPTRVLLKKLLSTQPRQVLLHGDFHHNNILLAEDNRWVAIDPEGLIGDPGYDMGLCIRNPLALLVHQTNAQEIIINRIKDFARLYGYDEYRLFQWTYVQAVSSAYWSLEDGLDIKNHCAFLEVLENIHKNV